MYDVHVFGSGSSGNCIYVNTGDSVFLLDAGLSFKDTKKNLKRIGARPSDVDFILITHTHSDHVYGLRGIAEKYNIPVVTTDGEALMLGLPEALLKRIQYDETIHISNMDVTGFKLPHDTNQPVYFSVTNSVGEKLLYLTDCGSDKDIEIGEHDFFIIEANYYLDGILNSLSNEKIHVVQFNRTTSGKGHLDIKQTISILKDSITERTEHIILSHLSSTNGNGELFKNMAIEQLGFDNVYIAENGLNVTFGETTNVF